MHWQAIQFVTTVKNMLPEFFVGKSVMEVGAYIVNDSVRELFDTDDYVGLDLCDGPGVDITASGDEYLRGEGETFDVVISCECFEHNPSYLETFQRMFDNLKPGGLFLFTCATSGRPEHGTTRSDPTLFPGTSSIGIDYYKNLSDFLKKLVMELGTPRWIVNNIQREYWGADKDWFLQNRNVVNRSCPELIDC